MAFTERNVMDAHVVRANKNETALGALNRGIGPGKKKKKEKTKKKTKKRTFQMISDKKTGQKYKIRSSVMKAKGPKKITTSISQKPSAKKKTYMSPGF